MTMGLWTRLTRGGGAAAIGLTLIVTSTIAGAEHPEIAKRRAAERKVFTDGEIITGFFKLTLSAEFQTGGRANRIRKFEGPVRVFVENRTKPDRSGQVSAAIADIKRHIEHIDLSTVGSRD